jgi:hypothetical protein
LQRFVIDTAAVQNEKDLLASLALDRLCNQWAIELRDLDKLIGEPAANLSNASGRFRLARNMLRDFAQVNGMRLNQSDDDPRPILDAAQVFVRMELDVLEHAYCVCYNIARFSLAKTSLCIQEIRKIEWYKFLLTTSASITRFIKKNQV